MVNISGKYRFFLDGELVSESNNLITTAGVNAIKQFLVGNMSSWAGAIGIGADSTAASTSNTRLGYEYSRQPVTFKYVDSSGNIVLRAAFPIGLQCVVKEIGVFPTMNASNIGKYQDLILTDFSEGIGTGAWSSATGVSSSATNSLSGTSNIVLTTTGSTVSTTLSSIGFSVGEFTSTDKIDVLVYNPTASVKNISVALSDGTTTYTVTGSTTSSSGAQIVSISVGSITISTVSSITVSLTSTSASIEFDSIKFSFYDESGLPFSVVSRSIPSPSITKTAGQDLEIEYTMTVA